MSNFFGFGDVFYLFYRLERRPSIGFIDEDDFSFCSGIWIEIFQWVDLLDNEFERLGIRGCVQPEGVHLEAPTAFHEL